MSEKIKSMVGVALLLAGALTAVADEYPAYFYWNVSDSVADFSYAQLRLSGGDTYFKIGDTDYTMVGAETTGGATLGQTTGTVAANLGSYATSDYSFLVEVFGEDDGLLAYSDAMSYDQLSQAVSSMRICPRLQRGHRMVSASATCRSRRAAVFSSSGLLRSPCGGKDRVKS